MKGGFLPTHSEIMGHLDTPFYFFFFWIHHFTLLKEFIIAHDIFISPLLQDMANIQVLWSRSMNIVFVLSKADIETSDEHGREQDRETEYEERLELVKKKLQRLNIPSNQIFRLSARDLRKTQNPSSAASASFKAILRCVAEHFSKGTAAATHLLTVLKGLTSTIDQALFLGDDLTEFSSFSFDQLTSEVINQRLDHEISVAREEALKNLTSLLGDEYATQVRQDILLASPATALKHITDNIHRTVDQICARAVLGFDAFWRKECESFISDVSFQCVATEIERLSISFMFHKAQHDSSVWTTMTEGVSRLYHSRVTQINDAWVQQVSRHRVEQLFSAKTVTSIKAALRDFVKKQASTAERHMRGVKERKDRIPQMETEAKLLLIKLEAATLLHSIKVPENLVCIREPDLSLERAWVGIEPLTLSLNEFKVFVKHVHSIVLHAE